MSSQIPIPIPDTDDAEDFSIEEEDDDIPDWHKKILDELLAKYEAEGFHGTPWEEFQRELHEEVTQALRRKSASTK